MTPLGGALARRIAQSGPISVAQFMAAALGDPEFGYYTRATPFGAAGDFITAPDISQMFGELIGLWCLALFENMGSPPRLRLIELGPGRGSLMADLWRAVKIRSAFQSAARAHLVELSPALRKVQAAALSGIGAAWHDDFADAAACDAEAPLIVIANEFFDALPVHQVERTSEGWRERTVGFDAAANAFRFSVEDHETAACGFVPESLGDAPPGSIFEISLKGRALMDTVAGEVAAKGGAALIVDYGHARSAVGDTLQAVRAHRYHDVLADPGEADITAHVDFEPLAEIARERGCQMHGPVPQGAFLRRLGIEARADALLARARPDQREQITSALRRLIDADKMGTLFKVLAVTQPGLATPGFDAAI